MKTQKYTTLILSFLCTIFLPITSIEGSGHYQQNLELDDKKYDSDSESDSSFDFFENENTTYTSDFSKIDEGPTTLQSTNTIKKELSLPEKIKQYYKQSLLPACSHELKDMKSFWLDHQKHSLVLQDDTSSTVPSHVAKKDPQLANLQNAWLRKKKRLTRISIEGAPGTGKTVLMQYLVNCWAKGKIWPQFDWVLCIHLAEMQNLGQKVPMNTHLAKKLNIPSMRPNDYASLMNSSNGLIIVDGYRFVADELKLKKTPLYEWLEQLKTKHTISILSLQYPDDNKSLFEAHATYKLLGLRHSGIALFINKYCQSEYKGKKLLSFIEECYTLRHNNTRQHLWAKSTGNQQFSQELPPLWDKNQLILQLAYIKQYLITLCDIAKSPSFGLFFLKKMTKTQFYELFIKKFFYHHTGSYKQIDLRLNLSHITKCSLKPFLCLATLAFKASQKNIFVINERIQKEALFSLVSDYPPNDMMSVPVWQEVVGTRLLVNYPTKCSFPDRTTQFVDNYVQYWFAAYYIVYILINFKSSSLYWPVKSMMNEHKYNGQSLNILPLVAGILYTQACEEKDPKIQPLLLQFWDWIETNVQLSPLKHATLVFDSLQECPKKKNEPKKITQRHEQLLNKYSVLLSYLLSTKQGKHLLPLYSKAANFLYEKLKYLPSIIQHPIFEKKIVEEIKKWDIQKTTDIVIDKIARLIHLPITPTCLLALLKLLNQLEVLKKKPKQPFTVLHALEIAMIKSPKTFINDTKQKEQTYNSLVGYTEHEDDEVQKKAFSMLFKLRSLQPSNNKKTMELPKDETHLLELINKNSSLKCALYQEFFATCSNQAKDVIIVALGDLLLQRHKLNLTPKDLKTIFQTFTEFVKLSKRNAKEILSILNKKKIPDTNKTVKLIYLIKNNYPKSKEKESPIKKKLNEIAKSSNHKVRATYLKYKIEYNEQKNNENTAINPLTNFLLIDPDYLPVLATIVTKHPRLADAVLEKVHEIILSIKKPFDQPIVLKTLKTMTETNPASTKKLLEKLLLHKLLIKKMILLQTQEPPSKKIYQLIEAIGLQSHQNAICVVTFLSSVVEKKSYYYEAIFKILTTLINQNPRICPSIIKHFSGYLKIKERRLTIITEFAKLLIIIAKAQPNRALPILSTIEQYIKEEKDFSKKLACIGATIPHNNQSESLFDTSFKILMDFHTKNRQRLYRIILDRGNIQDEDITDEEKNIYLEQLRDVIKFSSLGIQQFRKGEQGFAQLVKSIVSLINCKSDYYLSLLEVTFCSIPNDGFFDKKKQGIADMLFMAISRLRGIYPPKSTDYDINRANDDRLKKEYDNILRKKIITGLIKLIPNAPPAIQEKIVTYALILRYEYRQRPDIPTKDPTIRETVYKCIFRPQVAPYFISHSSFIRQEHLTKFVSEGVQDKSPSIKKEVYTWLTTLIKVHPSLALSILKRIPMHHTFAPYQKQFFVAVLKANPIACAKIIYQWPAFRNGKFSKDILALIITQLNCESFCKELIKFTKILYSNDLTINREEIINFIPFQTWQKAPNILVRMDYANTFINLVLHHNIFVKKGSWSNGFIQQFNTQAKNHLTLPLLTNTDTKHYNQYNETSVTYEKVIKGLSSAHRLQNSKITLSKTIKDMLEIAGIPQPIKKTSNNKKEHTLEPNKRNRNKMMLLTLYIPLTEQMKIIKYYGIQYHGLITHINRNENYIQISLDNTIFYKKIIPLFKTND